MEFDASRCLLAGLAGPTPTRDELRRLRRLAPAGVVLFRRNLESPAALAALLDQVRPACAEAPFLAIDQEGGRVSRLEPWIGATPTAAELARRGDEACARFGAATAVALRRLGLNLNFAPVVDLSPADATNGIGDRAFGTDPETVVRRAGAFLDGLQAEGVAGCLKHFPGLGDTHVDSHRELPSVKRDREALERLDLRPFECLHLRAAAVMVGHGHYPALDLAEPRPATCSPPIVDGLLRGWLGFRGLVVSDDMEMGAVADRDVAGAAAVDAVAAGCDLLLYCADLDRAEAAVEALRREAALSPMFRERLEQAARRVRQTAERWPAPESDLEGWETAREAHVDAAVRTA